MTNRFSLTFGQLPSSYVYEKIWSALPKTEKAYLSCSSNETMPVDEIITKVPYNEKSCSVYRDRLIKRGLINGDEHGKVSLVLPRFDIFISKQI